MNKNIFNTLIFALFVSLSATAQHDNNWALGLKVGEPLGLNIRKYFSYGDRAFDVNIGTYGFLYGKSRSYRKEVIYQDVGVMVQGLYHWNHTLGKRDKVNYYYGIGAQINSRNRPPKIGSRDSFKAISVGPAANAGIELMLPENDLSVFLDVGGYLEIVPKVFFVNPQINIGLRLNIVRK
jgi:hypothetical protein